MHLDPFLKAGESVQQHSDGAVVGRHFDTVDAAAYSGSEQPGGTREPGANIENTILGQNTRHLQQLALSVQSARMKMIERTQLLG